MDEKCNFSKSWSFELNVGRSVLGVAEITYWHRVYTDDTHYFACALLWKWGQHLKIQLFLLTFKIISVLEYFVF